MTSTLSANTTRHPPRISMEKRLSRTGLLFVLPFFIWYGVFQLFPILYSFYLSFFSWNGITEKTFIGLDNYLRLFTQDPYFLKSIGNVLLIMVGYLPATLVLGLLLSVLLYSKNIRGKRFFQTTQFLPYIVVPVACGLLFMLLFDWGTGVINRILLNLGLIQEGINWLGSPTTARLVLMVMQMWRQLGYVVTIYLAGMTSIPTELLEAAEIDGATKPQLVRRIIVPLLKNTSVFLMVTGIIDGFQLFDAPKVLFTTGQISAHIGGPSRSCLTPVWYLYDVAFGSSRASEMGYASTIAYGLFLFIILFSIINYRLSAGKGEDS